MRWKKFVDRDAFGDHQSFGTAVAKGVGGPDPAELSGNRPFAFGSGPEAALLRAVWGASPDEFCAAAMHEEAANQKANPGTFVRKFGKRKPASKKPPSKDKREPKKKP